jgi:predicted ATP-grasp superfamily ATP-dependent carboligase
VIRIAVAGLSVRALAQSARVGGFAVVGLDVFGDRDTRAACVAWHRIGDAGRIDPVVFQAALHELGADVVGWVPGAGFEAEPALLEAGGDALPCLGLGADVVRRVRSPQAFFAALDRHGIAHPEVAFDADAAGPGWLVKHAGGSGGMQVRRWPAAQAPDVYWQRARPGLPMSALFLADGERASVIAINRQLVEPVGALPFVYAGAIGPVHVPGLRARVEAALAALVPEFGVRGLASLDFIAARGEAYVLELNPRPSATMQLHDDACPAGLVRAHLQALAGTLPALRAGAGARGHRIVFAPRTIEVDAAASRALAGLGAHDVPMPGTRIAAGEPVCGVGASAGGADAALARLAARAQAVLDCLEPAAEDCA